MIATGRWLKRNQRSGAEPLFVELYSFCSLSYFIYLPFTGRRQVDKAGGSRNESSARGRGGGRSIIIDDRAVIDRSVRTPTDSGVLSIKQRNRQQNTQRQIFVESEKFDAFTLLALVGGGSIFYRPLFPCEISLSLSCSSSPGASSRSLCHRSGSL